MYRKFAAGIKAYKTPGGEIRKRLSAGEQEIIDFAGFWEPI